MLLENDREYFLGRLRGLGEVVEESEAMGQRCGEL